MRRTTRKQERGPDDPARELTCGLPVMKRTEIPRPGYRITNDCTGARVTVGPYRTPELARRAMVEACGSGRRLGLYTEFHFTPSWNGEAEQEGFAPGEEPGACVAAYLERARR